MTEPDSDRLAELRELASNVASTAHDDLPGQTIDAVQEFAAEVESNLDADERAQAARKLIAFWESFVRTKLGEASDMADDLAEETIARFEQAFDEDVIGIDLYQALETLTIVDEMPEEETDEDRLSQWASRVQTLTEDFASHLQGHRD